MKKQLAIKVYMRIMLVEGIKTNAVLISRFLGMILMLFNLNSHY